MKRNILILFAVVSFIISLTGCGSSGSSNSVAPIPTTMTSVKVNLTQNGQPATGAEAALYTPVAAMREGLVQAQNNSSLRTSIGISNLEGVYKPTSTSADGTYTFTVPTGEYTLIANKGTSRAVVTNLRAATGVQETEVIEVASLTPTGTIIGKVISSSNLTGVIVYLENTSLVAIADSEGSFKISGVPIGSHDIAAMSNQNGKYYAAATTTVVINEDLSVEPQNLELTLTEKKATNETFQIKGQVVDRSNTGIENVLVMATDEILLFIATTDEQGKFTINANKANNPENFTITVVGANPESVTIPVTTSTTSPFTLSSPFEISKTTSAYGCVKGNIKFSSDYSSQVTNDSKIPNVERYLVKLIGVDGTSYRTQTKADYKGNSTSEYMFDNIYPGTYTIFVDPAGNGFVGSVGTFTVESGKITDLTAISTGTAEVRFVQPLIIATSTEYNISIINQYPFISNNLLGYYKNIGIDNLPIKGFVSGNGEGETMFLFVTEDGGNPLTRKGKYEITIQNNWSDDVTGLSGILTGTAIVENLVNTTGFIGNITVTRPTESQIKVSDGYTGDFIDTDTGSLRLTGNIISYYDGSNDYYYYKNISSDYYSKNTISDLDDYSDFGGSLFDVSGQCAVFKYQNDYCDLVYFDGTTPKRIESGQSLTEELGFEDNDFESASIIGNNHIAYILYEEYFDEQENTIYEKIIKYGDPSNVEQIKTIKSFKHLETGDFPYYVRLSLSSNNTPYLLVLLTDNFDYSNELARKTTIQIYNCETKDCLVTFTYNSDTKIKRVSDFKVLKDGSFYIEINNSYVDSPAIGSDFSYAMRFVANNNFPVESSNMVNRQSCFMDKEGFMYRFDSATKSVIKTASLDGKPLDIYTESSNLNGILGFSEDGSTLYVW